MTAPKDPKAKEQHNEMSEAEQRKLQSEQDKRNQKRADHSRPGNEHRSQSQSDKDIAPQQNSRNSR